MISIVIEKNNMYYQIFGIFSSKIVSKDPLKIN